MKKYIVFGIGILCVMLAGCSDWLDVRPRNEMKEDDLYGTAEGFRQVLDGVYIALADTTLYGQNMTMLVPEYLAQHWVVKSNQLSGFLGSYDYTNANVESLIARIWKAYYNAIAHLNNLLGQIGEKSSLLTQEEYNLIKGEALGLRGFLHFELLRMFGPVPREAGTSQPAIPYVKEMTKEAGKLLSDSYGDVLKAIEEDLKAAEALLAEDPFIKYSYEFLNNPSSSENRQELEDLFYYYRQNHFNIYAAKAALARFYLWTGNPDSAYRYALQVIGARNTGGTEKFSLATESDLSTLGNEDRTFTHEHIFSVFNSRLSGVVESLFFQYNALTKEATYTNDANCYDYSISPNDIRNKEERYWGNEIFAQGSFRVYKKYRQKVSAGFQNVVPVIRLAEMYLIAMETAPEGEARQLFSTFRISRNMDAGTEETFKVEVQLEREYRKEFYAEGQMFWYYKRKNMPKITWGLTARNAVVMDAAKYVLPKPDSQIVFE